jgi:hypothetical protein
MLTNLDQLLVKAEENAKARGFDPNLLVTQRLAPDMRPLSSQIQLASDSAKGAMARLSGGTPPRNARHGNDDRPSPRPHRGDDRLCEKRPR